MNVLVVFYSSGGRTEAVALTAGVGAIQAHASIRLRRVPPGRDVDTARMTPAEREAFERMSRDYVAPRPEDAVWADAVILAASRTGVAHVEAYLEGLPASVSGGHRIAAPLDANAEAPVLRPLYAAAAAAGLIVLPMTTGPLVSAEESHAFGRRVVAIAKALKSPS